ncbi:MAG TPA: hypothetical protein VM285_10405 [Polyangia bacterium]|nr:hypothetical protein [Polyangia bacterium]
MRSAIRITVFLTMAAMFFGCDMPPTEPIQVISGIIAQDTFPSPVTTVRVVSAGNVVTEAAVGSQGGFVFALPVGKNYSIEFASGSHQPGLVFPRKAGGIDATFDIADSQAAFDMGAVRYIGDPSALGFKYVTDYNEGEGDNDNVECEDGIDLATGLPCVDDDAEDEACEDEDDDDDDECEQEGENEGENEGCDDDGDNDDDDGDNDDDDGDNDDGDNDDVECEDGVDLATGLPCEDDDDGEVEDDDDGDLPSEAAVADKNLPSSLGCGEDDDDDECEQEGEHEGENEGC